MVYTSAGPAGRTGSITSQLGTRNHGEAAQKDDLSGVNVLVVTLAGCGGSARAAKTADGLTEIKVGLVPNSTAAPVYIAESQGFFKKHGLNADIQPVAGGREEPSHLLSSDLTVGHTALVPTIIAASQNLAIKIAQVGELAPKNPADPSIYGVVAKADSPIDTYADLKGHKAATAHPALVRTTIGGCTKIDPASLEKIILPDFCQGRLSQADQGAADDLKKYGLVTTDVNVDKLISLKS